MSSETPKRIMVTILTSSKINYLKESFNSVINQKRPIRMKWDVFIVVNTLNDNYYKLVLDEFENVKVTIIRTESNGRPGKGHNSVLDFFKSRKEYDYLVALDGDDFLYPVALRHLELYISSKDPALLMLMYHDTLDFNLSSPITPNFVIDNKVYLCYNFTEHADNLWIREKSKSPFTHNITALNTIGRLILFSRESIKFNIRYDEDCELYDDFYPSMQLMELAYAGENIFCTSDPNIYLYNKLNNIAQSKKFHINMPYDRENEIFSKSIENKFDTIKDWNVLRIKYITVDTDRTFTFRDKYIFVTQLVKYLNIKNFIEDNNEYDLFKAFVEKYNLTTKYEFLFDKRFEKK